MGGFPLLDFCLLTRSTGDAGVLRRIATRDCRHFDAVWVHANRMLCPVATVVPPNTFAFRPYTVAGVPISIDFTINFIQNARTASNFSHELHCISWIHLRGAGVHSSKKSVKFLAFIDNTILLDTPHSCHNIPKNHQRHSDGNGRSVSQENSWYGFVFHCWNNGFKYQFTDYSGAKS